MELGPMWSYLTRTLWLGDDPRPGDPGDPLEFVQGQVDKLRDVDDEGIRAIIGSLTC